MTERLEGKKKKKAYHILTSQSTALHKHRTTSASQLGQKYKGKNLPSEHSKLDPNLRS